MKSSSTFSLRYSSSIRTALLLLSLLSCVYPCLAQTDAGDSVLAIVDGHRITAAAVDESLISQIYPLQQQIYALRKVALENLIARTLLETEAEKRSVSLDDLKRQLTAGTISVTKDQVEKLYQENISAFASMGPEEARERLRLDLESQARMRNYRTAVNILRDKATISVFLREPRLETVDTSDEFSVGSRSAAIVITEFSDFQCPYCRDAQPALKQVITEYGKQVRFVFKHLPLDIHAEAFTAAQSAVCAGEQSAFWKMHDALFALDALSMENITSTAKRLGLDSKTFTECLSAERSREAVRKDIQEARRLGINGTPTFLINGKLIRGAATFEALKTTIDLELALIRARPVNATAPQSQEK